MAEYDAQFEEIRRRIDETNALLAETVRKIEALNARLMAAMRDERSKAAAQVAEYATRNVYRKGRG